MQQVNELKAKVLEFTTKDTPMSDKQKILDTLKGLVSKRQLAAMTLQQVLELLTMVLEIPEVSAFTRGGETLTLGELTRKERKPRKMPEHPAAPTLAGLSALKPADDDTSENDGEDEGPLGGVVDENEDDYDPDAE